MFKSMYKERLNERDEEALLFVEMAVKELWKLTFKRSKNPGFCYNVINKAHAKGAGFKMGKNIVYVQVWLEYFDKTTNSNDMHMDVIDVVFDEDPESVEVTNIPRILDVASIFLEQCVKVIDA